MRKISIFGLILFLFACCFAVNSYAAVCTESTYENSWDHEYSVTSSVILSYLIDCSDDTLMRFQYDDINNTMFAEYYTYDYEFIKSLEIDTELPMFGGFHASDNYYFILTGQTNFKESTDVECFRITKYDKSWNRISSVGLYDCNTVDPFCAGNARFAECGDYLVIRTAHKMYKSEDNRNHQANVTIELNMNTMQITDYLTDIPSNECGYVSHSFNQFVEVENNEIVALDHGDAYPRSICLTQYHTDASDGTFVPAWWTEFCTVTDILPISGATGDNYTGCTVGGFEISPSAYIVAGTSSEQNKNHFYDELQNVFVASLSKTTGEVSFTYITDYSVESQDPQHFTNSVPFLVKLSDSAYLLIWENNSYVYYTKLNSAGKVVSKTYKMKASLSDCDPLVVNGKITWYVAEGNTVNFYSINASKLTETEKVAVLRGHDYKFVSAQKNIVNLTCSKCGDRKSGAVPTKYYIDQALLHNGYYTTCGIPSSVHPGDELYFDADISRSDHIDFYDTVLTSSDPSVAKVEKFYFGTQMLYKVTFLKVGNVDFVYSSVYPSEYSSQVSVTVKHSYDSGKVTKKATCKETGVKTYTCSECSATKKTTIAKAAHTYANSCDKTCNVCSATRNIIHKYKTTTTRATLTKSGSIKTACTICGTVKSITTISSPKTFTLSTTSYSYNGRAKTPTVTVKDVAGKVLKKGTDYTVTYASGRKNAGTYKVTVTMKGNYTGTKTLSFKINPISISKCTVNLSATSYTFDGKVKTPTVTVKNANGVKLANGTHYTVTCDSGRKNAGTYKVTVTMKGNYTGTKTLSFKITPISIAKCSISLSATSYTYDGKVKSPTVAIKNANGVKLTNGTHYTVSYASGRKNVGTYKVTVKMKGNYTGTKTLSFKINPPKTTVAALTAGVKKITVNLTKKTTQVTGYQIQYATNKNFTNAKTVTIAKNTTVKTTLSGLASAKTYYVRVRTFKTVNDVKYYSGWSASKYVKTK